MSAIDNSFSNSAHHSLTFSCKLETPQTLFFLRHQDGKVKGRIRMYVQPVTEGKGSFELNSTNFIIKKGCKEG